MSQRLPEINDRPLICLRNRGIKWRVLLHGTYIPDVCVLGRAERNVFSTDMMNMKLAHPNWGKVLLGLMCRGGLELDAHDVVDCCIRIEERLVRIVYNGQLFRRGMPER